jgi:hypothetical protein
MDQDKGLASNRDIKDYQLPLRHWGGFLLFANPALTSRLPAVALQAAFS